MSLRSTIQSQLEDAQRKLAIVNGIPEDTFNLGTVAVFSAPNNQRWYYVKVGEELWANFTDNTRKDLATRIFELVTTNAGYFEVYMLVAPPIPVYVNEAN